MYNIKFMIKLSKMTDYAVVCLGTLARRPGSSMSATELSKETGLALYTVQKLLKLLVDFYKKGQQALKEGASLADIRAMAIVGSMLKARMDIKDDEMPKLDQLEVDMQEQFKNITGVKVQN